MAQFTVKILRLAGSVLDANQQDKLLGDAAAEVENSVFDEGECG